MPPQDNIGQHEAAKQFVRDHLTACAIELRDWRRSGLLVDGRMRELETIVHEQDPAADAIGYVETLVVAAVIEEVARPAAGFRPANTLQPGFYWWRLAPADSAEVVQVTEDQAVYFTESEKRFFLPAAESPRDTIRGEFAGPLAPPTE